MSETAAGVCILGFVVLILLGGWCLVRLGNLTARALAKNPRCIPLWLAIAAFCGLFVLLILTLALVFIPIWVASGCLLAIVARAVELRYSELFQEPPSISLLASDVLHDWWKAA